MKFYGVRRGRITGVFDNWEACRQQVFQYPNAEFKSFPTKKEAQDYVKSRSCPEPSAQPPESPTLSGLHAWVDGACLEGPDGSLQIGWGVLVTNKEKEIYRDQGNDIPLEAMEHRNVAGEIWAILKVIQWCQSHHFKELTIHYDYQGLENWVTGAWKTNLPFTRAYAQRVRDSGLKIHWKKVKAHTGIPENEIVDQLAKEGAKAGGKKRQ